MAEDDDDDFSFGDFKFAPSSQSQCRSQPDTNGVTSTSNNYDDDLWGNFIVTPQTSSSRFQSNNGFSPNSSNSAQLTSPLQPDPGLNKFQKPKGALPLSLFGEVEEEEEDGSNNDSNDDSNGCFDPNPLSQKGKSGVNNNGVLTQSDNGLGLNYNGVASDLIVDNDGGEWEFKGAFSGNISVEEGILKGSSTVIGSKVEPLATMKQEKQAGQYASSSIDFKPGSVNFAPQSNDFFAASYGYGPNHQSNGLDIGFNSTTSTTNSFMWDPFPKVESIGNGTGLNASSLTQDDDFDEFGDFIDASQEVVSKEQEPVAVQMNHAEAQVSNGEVQEKQTQTGYSRGALPLSFFGDDTEESSDGLSLQNEVSHIATLSPGNSFSGQGSAISINDLISNLYSQAQLTSSVNSTEKPAENGLHSPPKVMGTTTLVGDADWDDDSWEFKGAVLENGVKDQLSTSLSGDLAQKQPGIFPELHDYTEFYEQLRDSLCSLLSCQLDGLKKARSSDAVAANGENLEAVDDEIQEALKLLEESVNSKEALANKDLERDSWLDKLLEVLQVPKFNVIESDFQLSKRLQSAVKEWRIAVELLQHAILMLKILSVGVADEQSLYASTWLRIINVCVQELRHGASIWKRASEKNVQHQILSNSQGQQNILALGEIYKVVKVLGLSAKVYKPFVIANVSDSAQFFGVLDECDVLWSKLGLEGAIQCLSDNADFEYSRTAETLIDSIKNILDIDTVALHGRVFTQCKALCQLSLLPQEMLADLKTVMWGEKAYFLNLANLWANLISCDPPQLPQLQVS